MGQAHEQRFVKKLIAQSTSAGSHRMSANGPLAVGPVLIGLHVKAADRVVVQICVITVGHGF